MTDRLETTASASPVITAWSPPAEFDEYRIIQLLGRGAMGQVYLAQDTQLDRLVAVKFIAARVPNNEDRRRERFRLEARAIARLHHPNVVMVHRVGEVDGQPYLVSEYVRGERLDAVAKPVAWPRLLAIATDLARGLGAAHQQGVLHRDIKPANVMVTADGTAKLLDFGLAKLIAVSAGHDHSTPREREAHDEEGGCGDGDRASGTATQLPRAGTDAVVGTPLYMAPEIWRQEAATRLSDVYSLGVVLYELCAGRLPHAGLSASDLRTTISTTPLRPLREAAPDIDASFAALVDRCVATDPALRPASGDDVCEALEAIGAGQRMDSSTLAAGSHPSRAPVHERASSPGAAWRRYGMALALAAIVLGVLGFAVFQRASAPPGPSPIARSDVAQAVALLSSDHPDGAIPYLLAAREAGLEDLSTRALFRWATQYVPLQRLVHHGFVRYVAWSPDGRWLATGSDDGTARVWDPESGQPVAPPLVHHSPVRALAWSPRGRWLATADDHAAWVWDVRVGQPVTPPLVHDGNWMVLLAWSPDESRLAIASHKIVQIWDASSGRETPPPIAHHGDILAIEWSPDGRRLATASADMTAQVWDAASGQAVTPPILHQGWIRSVMWSPDGHRLATASDDGTARVWDASSGQAVTPPLVHLKGVFKLAWSPDGQRLATASSDWTARMWDANSGQALTPPIKHDSAVSLLAWSPDGRRVASAGVATTARIWDASSGHEVYLTIGDVDDRRAPTPKPATPSHVPDADSGVTVRPLPVRGVSAIAWSPDGRWLATAGSETAQVWDADSQLAVTPPLPNRGSVLALAWSPDGRRLATGSWDQRARIWDVARIQPTPPLRHDGMVDAVTWSPDGSQLATASQDGTARVWDARSGRPVAPALRHQGAVNTVVWNPAGTWLATASNDQTVRVWDARSGQPVTPSLVHPRRVTMLAWSPPGRQLATVSDGQSIRIWNVSAGEALPALADDGFVASLTWKLDELRVATAGLDGTARVWDRDRQRSVTLSAQSRILAMAWSPDETRVATASQDGTVRLWDAASGRPLTPPLAHGSDVVAVAWSPDGKRVATGVVNGTALIWDSASGQQVAPPLTHRGRVARLAWSPDGTLLATGSDDGTARVWDAASGQPVTPPLAHRIFLTAVAWSPDGRRLATASADNTARVWDVWDAGTLADWRAAAERCEYRLNSAGVLVEWDPMPDVHSSPRGLPSVRPGIGAGQGSGTAPDSLPGAGSATASGFANGSAEPAGSNSLAGRGSATGSGFADGSAQPAGSDSDTGPF